MYAEVLVEIKAKNIDKTFTYEVPLSLKEKLMVGIRVKVPFGKQILEGFVLNIKNNFDGDYKLKEIIDIVDDECILNKELLDLGVYLSKKTLTNLIGCYQTMLPKALKAKNGVKINKKYITYLKLNHIPSKMTQKQEEIIKLFNNKDTILKSDATKISLSSTHTLIKNKVLSIIEEEVYRYNISSLEEKSTIKLNKEQATCVNSVLNQKDKFTPFLLYGVTGSGKTEVYMHIIKEIIKEKSALVLVPEISLTPQFINNFKKRFGSNIAVLHSSLSDGERYDEWRKIRDGLVKIVIGVRSAIFAPISNLGIIIIDEEHSDTYKQENNPKYNTIDMALFRAKYNNCPLILGSATPSIESYTRAKNNIYTLLVMKNRINNTMPKITRVDMKDEIKSGNRVLSSILIDKINETLEKNKQVILFLNRRGYSTVITCHACGYTLTCPFCDIALTYHKNSNILRCHYCGYATKKVDACPNCKSHDINEFGLGTEKLEEIVKEKFPLAKVIRMDVDTTVTKNSHEKITEAFRKKEYNILIGTQMVSKGLDFEDVTLVGIINADSSLNVPDFRSGERTFSLLSQTSGRAGRSKTPGEVIIQGFNIDNYSIKYSSLNDYEGFYNYEMSVRKKLKYPPFYNLCLIKISSKNENLITEEAVKIKNYLMNNLDRTNIILGPSNANMFKVNNVYFKQVIIKFKNTSKILEYIKFINDKYKTNRQINVEIDLNPLKL